MPCTGSREQGNWVGHRSLERREGLPSHGHVRAHSCCMGLLYELVGTYRTVELTLTHLIAQEL